MEKILTLPRMGETMEQGTVISWNRQPGEAFTRGEALLELETDKMIAEVPALEDGTLLEILAPENSEVEIGAPLARVEVAGEASSAQPPEPEPASVPAAAPSPPANTAPAPEERPHLDSGKIRATPAARRLAQQRGLDLTALTGSGPLGRIEKRDLPRSGEAAPQVTVGSEITSQLTVGGTELRVFRRGSGDTPVLFLHGFGGDLFSFRYQLVQLAKETEVVAFDLPGHGGSSALPGTPGVEEFSHFLDQALPALGLGPVHLVGHSMGGGVALEFASRNPTQVASLTLLAPVGLGPEIHSEFVHQMATAAEADTLRPALYRLFYESALVNNALLAPLLEQRRAPGALPALQAIAQGLHDRGRQRWQGRGRLDTLPMPVKLIWGREDQVLPVAQATQVPGIVGTHFFPQCGHLPQVEAALPVLRLLREFTR